MTIEEILLFRAEIRRLAGIATWSPSEKSLALIAKGIVDGRIRTRADLCKAVAQLEPETRFALNEGLDMSDVTSLLALATKVSPPSGKP